MRILLTGSTGFLGSALQDELVIRDVELVTIGRDKEKLKNHDYIYTENITSESQFNLDLHKCDVAIHCAARVHVMNESSINPLDEFRKVNVYGTLALAQQAAASGIKRFIFISSIKVNGESTSHIPAFNERSALVPEDPYSLSKKEAEDGLQKISRDTGMEVVILRPPLVYGPGVKANFYNLLKLANTGLPLPFGVVHNLRSMIYVGNLVDFILRCIDHPAAANETFLLSDRRDMSLAELLILLRKTMGRPTRLVPVPICVFRIAGFITGKGAYIDRLVGSLQIDGTKSQELLDWQPPFTVEQGIKATTDYFLKDK
ncbi:UDP-glucose 4-epimerase family protein [Amphritea japonica]|uniref:UDP-glucose 4-epimerase n=1 Tax=Amphritea japonica ATCC BAA-1530 TaxID=1278309 RepID=A0A7R6PBS6_9GAMM|nr:SDR family oxidoreductase [Amphritea japonica]BBB25226.1 UDP-glucose 4-epimerase [Amphritea japonica ATCC BAA-1530]